ncbi:hypothetical protein NA78x_001389 [Anatilimnocola sp. NA78]|uniref:hypothetical protein n=1 Tax=Anatilimnocola sp. NA78 TaxID=3415683 RepID=UPI003CE4CF45
MPLLRVDAFNDAEEDLELFGDGFAFVGLGNNGAWDDEWFTPQADHDLILDGVSAAVTDLTSQVQGEAFTLTPINSIASVGDLDSAMIGQMLTGVFIDDGVNGFCSWQMRMAGSAQFEVLENTEHDPPEEITLRLNLALEATSTNSVQGVSTNNGFLFTQVMNVTTGQAATLAAQWNDQIREWEWILTDDFNNVSDFGSTEDGLNEGAYIEVAGISVGDNIRISFDNDMDGYCTGLPHSQIWTSATAGWFDVIGD